MPLAGDHHRQLMLLAIGDGVLVPNRTSGLDESGYACLMAQLHTIVKGEEGVAGHHSPLEFELELMRLLQGMAEGIDPAGLPTTFADQLSVPDQCDGIRLEVFADDIGELQVL